MKVYFLYWAHNSRNEARRFMLEDYFDIGSTIKYKGEWVTIDDMAEEVCYAEGEGY